MLPIFFRKQWVKIDLELAVKATEQKKDDIHTASQLAMQRNAETMATFVQQAAQSRTQPAAQPSMARRGGLPSPSPPLHQFSKACRSRKGPYPEVLCSVSRKEGKRARGAICSMQIKCAS